LGKKQQLYIVSKLKITFNKLNFYPNK